MNVVIREIDKTKNHFVAWSGGIALSSCTNYVNSWVHPAIALSRLLSQSRGLLPKIKRFRRAFQEINLSICYYLRIIK